jgi:hypothetical protein
MSIFVLLLSFKPFIPFFSLGLFAAEVSSSVISFAAEVPSSVVSFAAEVPSVIFFATEVPSIVFSSEITINF